jgi:hypothetical protein
VCHRDYQASLLLLVSVVFTLQSAFFGFLCPWDVTQHILHDPAHCFAYLIIAAPFSLIDFASVPKPTTLFKHNIFLSVSVF